MFRWLSLILVAVIPLMSCATPDPPALSTQELGSLPRVTLLWISVDGLRHDYVERAKAPFLLKLQREGAYTNRLLPAFPTLTFCSHSAQATGTHADAHGVTGNSFYDRKKKERFSFPQEAQLLESEPIWRTATRQGIRTAVFDWPFSNAQRGDHAAAYFTPGTFDPKMTDADRAARIARTYEGDNHIRPLRLLMGYVEGADEVGHIHGPDSRQVDEAVLATDRAIEAAVAGVQTHFEKIRRRGDQLCVLITTDHGMAKVHTLINHEELLREIAPENSTIDASGPVANVFLPEGTPPERVAEMAARLEAAVRNIPNHPEAVKAYSKDKLPAEWHYAHATRTGDIVLVAAEGYTFSSRIDGVVADTRAVGGPLGMHGYPVDLSDACRGYMVFWRAGSDLAGKNLGEVEAVRLHATVAKLLNVSPAPYSAGPALTLP